jgi:adenine specific DNA methylase Mod
MDGQHLHNTPLTPNVAKRLLLTIDILINVYNNYIYTHNRSEQ